ncbi:SMO [Bugula neritina]|uniref:SMO n=1 Tax=Bugula neritina TaxID=10212 RepID=A0A7J7JQ38_BUGNE|nr:SMO [Bugula neritina]
MKQFSDQVSLHLIQISLCHHLLHQRLLLHGKCWLAGQFAGPEARDSIVCRRDGTVRLAEPLVGEGKETVTCTVVFFIVYYFMLAGVTWFVILAYSWHVSFKKLQKGSVDDKLQPKIAYFHIIAWTLPLICAIIAMSLQKVDGDSLSGICFVGYVDKFARGFLVLFPITLALVSGLFFLLQGVVLLYKVRQCSDGIRNNKAAAKLTTTILRLGIFSTLAFIFVTLTLIIHIYDFNHKDLWEKSFKTYTICKASAKFDLRQDDDSTCEFKYRPNLATIYLNIFSYFGAGIMMSSWTWTKASKETWLRFFRKLLSMPTNKPIKLKSKHKMIALAFQKNQQKKGRKLSLDFHTSTTILLA